MISFNDLIDQLDAIKETIEADSVFEPVPTPTDESRSFTKHLHCTKSWYLSTSWANKKSFVLSLLGDVTSVWTVSLVLKSTWNCRTKDAVMSAKDFIPWSSYDQVPLDHNRAAVPLKTLTQVMKDERVWFQHLDAESQATVLLELLSISGGPIMTEFVERAQSVYERSRDHQLTMIHEWSPPEPVLEKGAGDKAEPHLVNWNAAIKAMRTNLKLEELELTSQDGTRSRLWKVNRVRPEGIETVDFLQLLPASLGKQILTYLPRANLGDYARVNKYWAFLVDELKAETAARLKIQVELEKLQDAINRYEDSLERPASTAQEEVSVSLDDQSSMTLVPKQKFSPYPVRKKSVPISRPACKVSELTGRLNRRGAADSSLFRWCAALMRERRMRRGDVRSRDKRSGLLPVGEEFFSCPLLKRLHCVAVPLQPPLYKEPMTKEHLKLEQSTLQALNNMNLSSDVVIKDKMRYKLWNEDFSRLMPVYKIAAHQF